jgi:hypothetical protein
MTEIRADMGQHYAMKSLFEHILGRASFRRVKDYAPLPVWKAESKKLLRAVGLSIESTVEVVDEEGRSQTIARSRLDAYRIIYVDR